MSEKIQPLTMPQWGLTMTEGTLVKWNAKEGDKISEKSAIAEKNVIIILMSIELILLSVNINFIAFSSFSGDLSGQIFAMLTLTVAAAEAAIGLAILVVFFRNLGSISVENISKLKG